MAVARVRPHRIASPRNPLSVFRGFETFLTAALVALVALCVLPIQALAQDTDTVTLNFVNADIDAVVKAVSEITGRNFIVDPRVKGTVNIVSARPVPKSLVYPTLMSALRMQGFTAIETDGLVKIVPEADAKQQGGPVTQGPVGTGGDRLITQVVTLRNESAAALVNVLRPLISPNNTIAAYPATNALVITDYADNVRRIMRIVGSLDQPPAGEPLIVPLKYASALDMVQVITRSMTDTGAGAPQPGVADAQQRVSIVADPRSNSLLVRSDNPARAQRVRQLIEQLDTPQRAGGNVFIVYLKNADALRVAETLRGLYGGGGGGDRSVPTAAAPPTPNPMATSTSSTGAGATSGLSTSAAATTPLSSGSATAGSAPIVAGGATIQADAANNALIIMAPEPIYNNLRAVIEKLDVRRAQVFIEALVVEVTEDRAGEFGIQWQVLTGGKVFGGTNLPDRGTGRNILDASANIGTIAQGLNIGVINGRITLPGIGEILNLAFLARAFASDTKANILSTPTLLTLDNEEARIMVGQNVPFVTGQYSTPGSITVQPFTTIERRDVGLLLRVKPQITEGGTVRMVLYQEVSRVQDGTATNVNGPTLSKRSLESSVVVDDQQIVVLGGLIQDSFTDTTDKVPYAGDIPAVGQLFRYDSRARTKTNLLVFIKPTVVRTAADGHQISSERYDYLRGEQGELQPKNKWWWPDPTYPELPGKPAMGGVPIAPPPAPPNPPVPAPTAPPPSGSPQPFVSPPDPAAPAR